MKIVLPTNFWLITVVPALICCGPTVPHSSAAFVAEDGPSGRPEWVTCYAGSPGQLHALGVASARVKREITIADACQEATLHLARASEAQVLSANMAHAWSTGDYLETATAADAPEGLDKVVAGAVEVRATWLDPTSGTAYCLVGIPDRSQNGGEDPCLLPPNRESWCGVPEGRSRPVWADTIPGGRISGVLYAVGVARPRAFLANAIEESIRNAMGNLATTLSATVSGLVARKGSETGGLISAEMYTSASGTLSGARMIAWWADPGSGETYALVCLPTAGVKVDLARRAAQALRTQGPPPLTTNPEAIHEEQIRKLEDALDREL